MNEPIKKQKFSVKLDILVPMTLTLQVEAEDEQSALLEIEKPSVRLISRQEYMGRKKKVKAVVYKHGTTLMLAQKSFR